MSWLVALWQQFLLLLFGCRCLVCRQPGDRFCSACRDDLRPLPRRRCPLCSDVSVQEGVECGRCQRRRPVFDGVHCLYQHRGAVRKALYRVKFRRQRALALELGGLMAAWQPPWPVDMVVPVPLHAARQAERGFNQAALLARPLAERLHLPLSSEVLVRPRATSRQHSQTTESRHDNVRHAFEARDVAGRTVLLVDDIMTTGATLDACAHALRRAGARTVYAVTLTRVVSQAAQRQWRVA